eukprot:scaffold1325_cov138-Amphora_coffeaeformis.AAC.9
MFVATTIRVSGAVPIIWGSRPPDCHSVMACFAFLVYVASCATSTPFLCGVAGNVIYVERVKQFGVFVERISKSSSHR